MAKTIWTQKLTDKLTKIYPNRSTKEVAKMMGIKYSAVKSRAKFLKLRKDSEYVIDYNNSPWTEGKDNMLKQLYPEKTARELSTILGFSLGQIKNRVFKLKIKSLVNNGQFKKGQIPKNPFPKGVRHSISTEFKSGQIPHNVKSDGEISIRTDKRGIKHKWIRIGIKKWRHLSRYNWEKENGPVPLGMLVCYKDGNTLNLEKDDCSNLILLTEEENAIRNSGSINITDNYVAYNLARKEPHLREDILKFPTLIDAKRNQIKLNRLIKKNDDTTKEKNLSNDR